MKLGFVPVIVAGTVLLAALAPVTVYAAKGAGHMAAAGKADTMKCPICHMAMPNHKTAAAPARVHVGSHYYYCCTACGYKGDSRSTGGGKMGSGKMGGGKMGGGKMGGHMGGKM